MKHLACIICGVRSDHAISTYCYKDLAAYLLVPQGTANPTHLWDEIYMPQKWYGKGIDEFNLKESS